MENAKTVLKCTTSAIKQWNQTNQNVKNNNPPTKGGFFCYFILARIAYLLLVCDIKLIYLREYNRDSWNWD